MFAARDTVAARRETFNLRIKTSDSGPIDRAALATGKTRTDFVLEAARRRAMGLSVPLSAPEPLKDAHDSIAFSFGIASLVEWLRRRAKSNQVSGGSRTYTLAEVHRVVSPRGFACSISVSA